MGIIIGLIVISLAIALVFLGFFLWTMRSGQFDDTYTPSVRMLFEDKTVKEQKTAKKAQPEKKNR